MGKPSAKGNATQRTAVEWADARRNDPAHRADVDALITEMDLRQELIALREARRLTQVELAARLGVQQPVIAKLEGGKTKDVKLSTLVKVAAALGARVKISFETYADSKSKRKTAAA